MFELSKVFLYFLIQQTAVVAFSLARSKALATFTGAGGYGLIAQATSLVLAFQMILSAGLGSGFVKLIAENASEQAAQARNRIASGMYLLGSITGLVGIVLGYRINNNIDQDSVALAVVVQELIFADAAGILFTANPINGKRDELLINAAWGLGEAVVSGAVTPDTLTINKQSGKVVRREIAEKQVMTVRTSSGTEEQPVPQAKRNKAVLNPQQIADLTQLAVKIEQFHGMPMDVEWALAGNTFAIVQARPITVLPLE
ncbi:MAG: hypothetical protein GYA48_16385 [Chloroflexi bacterium]|nr:hypothetical protein [Chloroflexota bacterium]